MSLPERRGVELKQNQQLTQGKQTPTNPRVMRKIISVNLVNTRSNKEQKTDEKQINQKNVPDTEIDFETPEKSIDGRNEKRRNRM